MEENPKQIPSTADNPKRMDSQVPCVVAEDSPKESGSKSTGKNYPPIHWRLVRDIVLTIGAFAAASVLVWHSAQWLQDRVDQAVTSKLSEEKILRQIAAQVKPSFIFDAKESIMSDMGAAQFVKDIRITGRTNGLPKTIIIDCTRHFDNAPIMAALHDSAAIFTKRGRLNSWEFEISWHVSGFEHEDDDTQRLYRLEFFP